ncbi:hypothetical protein JNUCC1_01011 [Lentibacillus sp. JNUCC-1]|nr:hypothetical protein [Lentibacillus sp. JNUCC-1]
MIERGLALIGHALAPIERGLALIGHALAPIAHTLALIERPLAPIETRFLNKPTHSAKDALRSHLPDHLIRQNSESDRHHLGTYRL